MYLLTISPFKLAKRWLTLVAAAGGLFAAHSAAAQSDTIRVADCPASAISVMTEPDTGAAWFRVLTRWSSETPGSWSNDSLRTVLRALAAKDQAVRRGVTVDSTKDSAFLHRMRVVDSANTVAMRGILARYGWPGKSMVGAEGTQDAFLLVQHSDELRARALALMQAAGPGEVMPSELALVVDRERTTAGRPQVYGSQLDTLTNGVLPFFPVEDPAHVEQRRASAGLPPLRTYACVMATMYKAPVVLPRGVPR
jgi:uncharacterized protein DUF6624